MSEITNSKIEFVNWWRKRRELNLVLFNGVDRCAKKWNSKQFHAVLWGTLLPMLLLLLLDLLQLWFLEAAEISCGVQSRKNRKKQTQITKSQKSWRKHEHKFVYSTGFSVLTNTYSCIEQEAMRKRDSQFFYESPLADSFLSGGALRMNYQNFICFAFSSNW